MARKVRTYTETERVGVMLMALKDGAYQVAEDLGIPVRTIYAWFDDAGGLAQIRTFVNEAETQSMSNARRAICEEIISRAGKMSNDDLGVTFRKMLEEGGPGAAGVQVGAAAQAVIQVNVDGETIELKR